jgi:hypothetical protein
MVGLMGGAETDSEGVWVKEATCVVVFSSAPAERGETEETVLVRPAGAADVVVKPLDTELLVFSPSPLLVVEVTL